MSASQPASANRAVFLSYASQDAEPAKRVCEALRSAGLEVWFDQSELRGGDAWDQSIRSQIRSCALFVPVISRHTQARLEGYFRLEWRLADQRTHLMAKGRPFLVPVVVDDTPDAEARVPESFLEVQWTRLPGGEAAAEFAKRIASLLSTGAAPAPSLALARDAALGTPGSPGTPRRFWLIATVLAAGLACVGVSLFLLRPGRNFLAGNEKLSRALALTDGLRSTMQDFKVAEDIVRAELARHSDDPDPVLAMARICNGYLYRGFDVSEDRVVEAQHYAALAMQLAPGKAETLAQLADSLALSRTDLPRAEQLVRQAIDLVPDELRYYRIFDYDILRHTDINRAVKSAERTAALFPKRALAQYDLSLIYRYVGRWDESEMATRATLALDWLPAAGAWQTRFLIFRHGDLAGAAAALDRAPLRDQTDPRVALGFFLTGVLSGQTDAIEKALGVVARISGAWIEDNTYSGPKALLLGQLYKAEGKANAAQAMFAEAMGQFLSRETDGHASVDRMSKCWTLLESGKKEEAQTLARAMAEARGELESNQVYNTWWFSRIPLDLLVDNRITALKSIKEMASLPGGPDYLLMAFKLDPRMAPFRDDPEIVGLIHSSSADKASPALSNR